MPIRPSQLDKMPDKDLLRMRFCDLPLRLKGSAIEQRAKSVFDELRTRRIRIRPAIWVAEEWYNPDGVVGFAVPFYLLHPRLVRLERRIMLEAEGLSMREALSILRHETGHAVDEAFQLHEMREYWQVFGSPQRRYPEGLRRGLRTVAITFSISTRGTPSRTHSKILPKRLPSG